MSPFPAAAPYHDFFERRRDFDDHISAGDSRKRIGVDVAAPSLARIDARSLQPDARLDGRFEIRRRAHGRRSLNRFGGMSGRGLRSVRDRSFGGMSGRGLRSVRNRSFGGIGGRGLQERAQP